MYTMNQLSDRKVKDAEVSRFLRQVFSDESKEVPVFNERAAATTKLLFDGTGRGAELRSAKGTVFGLINSVTEFVDHMRRARGANYRLESAWLGQGALLKQKALDQSLAMIA